MSSACRRSSLPPPDGCTRIGGNQYINSVATGALEDFLAKEMLPTVEQRFRCGGPGWRGVYGKSSGGYGAITHAPLALRIEVLVADLKQIYIEAAADIGDNSPQLNLIEVRLDEPALLNPDCRYPI